LPPDKTLGVSSLVVCPSAVTTNLFVLPRSARPTRLASQESPSQAYPGMTLAATARHASSRLNVYINRSSNQPDVVGMMQLFLFLVGLYSACHCTSKSAVIRPQFRRCLRNGERGGVDLSAAVGSCPDANGGDVDSTSDCGCYGRGHTLQYDRETASLPQSLHRKGAGR